MIVKILRDTIGVGDSRIEDNLNVLMIEESEHYQIILHCYNGSSVKVNLKDILYMTPFTIIKKEGR